MVGAPDSEWFTAKVIADHEFPGGAHVRTQVKDGACVFRNPPGRGCADPRLLPGREARLSCFKPMVSVLFPVTFEHGVLTASGEAVDGSLICAGEGPSLYEGARSELGYYFGAGLVAELDQLESAPWLMFRPSPMCRRQRSASPPMRCAPPWWKVPCFARRAHGGRVFLKLELLQRTGSFKFRGAAQPHPDDSRRTSAPPAWWLFPPAIMPRAWRRGAASGHARADRDAGRRAQSQDRRHPRFGAEIVSYDRVRDDREAIAASICRRARRDPDQAL